MGFLNEQVHHLWPQAVHAPGRFRWELLVDPSTFSGTVEAVEAVAGFVVLVWPPVGSTASGPPVVFAVDALSSPLQALNPTANASNAAPIVRRRWIGRFKVLAVTAKM